MEAKTFFRFFPKLVPIIKDGMETLPLFFTLHPIKDCNIKQISIYHHLTNILYIKILQ